MGSVQGKAGRPWYDESTYNGKARDTSVPMKQKMFFWEVNVTCELDEGFYRRQSIGTV
jgi:hypothetical protein